MVDDGYGTPKDCSDYLVDKCPACGTGDYRGGVPHHTPNSTWCLERQLAKAKDENQKLKTAISGYSGATGDMQQNLWAAESYLAQVQAENKRLKARIAELEAVAKNGAEYAKSQMCDCYDEYGNRLGVILCERCRFLQAAREAKEKDNGSTDQG